MYKLAIRDNQIQFLALELMVRVILIGKAAHRMHRISTRMNNRKQPLIAFALKTVAIKVTQHSMHKKNV